MNILLPRSTKQTNREVSMTERQGQSGGVDTEDQLRARVADCEAKLELMTDLAARVRHEINNPLTGVLGQAQLLLREELNDKARKRAQIIEELAIRMRDIVAQLRQVQLPPHAGHDGNE
jgi:signal transduction histidine kinase